MTEQLHFPFSLSCTGEGNGNPLQCSCLENPRDGGAWWAAVYGVVRSRTQLKRRSSSSGSSPSLNRFHPIKSGAPSVVSLKNFFYLLFLCLATSHPICGMRDRVP